MIVVTENLNTGAKKRVRNHLQKETEGEFMGKKYTLEDGMALLKEQLPNVANAFGVLRNDKSKTLIEARYERRTLYRL